MSNAAMKWAYDQQVTPAGAKFVLVTLADFADGDGYCYPGQESLSLLTGQSERAVRKHLDDLEAAGYLYRCHRYDDHGHRTSDACVLIGFKHLTAESAARLAEDRAGRRRAYRQKSSSPTGRNRPNLPAESAASIKDEPPVEPSGEPSEGARARARRYLPLAQELVRFAVTSASFDSICEALASIHASRPDLTADDYKRAVYRFAWSTSRAPGRDPLTPSRSARWRDDLCTWLDIHASTATTT